jgi:hypothetical protein
MYGSIIHIVEAAASRYGVVVCRLITSAEALYAPRSVTVILIQLSSAAWRNGIASDYDLQGFIPPV